jgi:glycosyltransferase involved in cell wall biosynthesis
MSHDVKPILSILVPCYNQSDGVARIFDRLTALRGCSDIEIFVSDDSSKDSEARLIRESCDIFGSVSYVRNVPPLQAVPNWNALLSRAQGEFCWLLHHDDAPSSQFDFEALLCSLKHPKAADVLVMECRVVHTPGARALLHFPVSWTIAIAKRWPEYLLRRNLVGSPSNLIVRNRCYPRFDDRLKWRVDVEAYVRLLRSSVQIRRWRQGWVDSYKDRTNSITAQLIPNLPTVERYERSLLATASGACQHSSIWLDEGLAGLASQMLEKFVWNIFRAVYRVVQHLPGLRF